LSQIDEIDWLLSGRMEKEQFVKEFKKYVLDWTKNKEPLILQTIKAKKYSWKGESYEDSVKRRNVLEYLIKKSREANANCVDLVTLNKITQWGFGRNFPLSCNEEALKLTREVFENVDKREFVEAAKCLMQVSGVGIARATKVISLADQENLCIYDSRVGNALKDLKVNGRKLIKCPPDQGFKRDYDVATKNEWATNYERLIWTIEIIKDYFFSKGIKLKASDIEIALFMIGE
jgi:hypothetical protein